MPEAGRLRTSFKSSHEVLLHNKPTFIPSFSTVIITLAVLWLRPFDPLIVSLSLRISLFISYEGAVMKALQGQFVHMKPFNGFVLLTLSHDPVWAHCHCHCTSVWTACRLFSFVSLSVDTALCDLLWMKADDPLMFMRGACLSDWIRPLLSLTQLGSPISCHSFLTC